MPPRRRALYGASVAGILNADVRSDDEAKSRVFRLFGCSLLILFFLDVGSAFAVLVLQCRQVQGGQEQRPGSGAVFNFFLHGFVGDSDVGSATAKCLQRSILHGFTFSPNMMKDHHSDDDGHFSVMGDLFLLAINRCIMLALLLFLGIRYGSYERPSTEQLDENNSQNPPQSELSADTATTTTAIHSNNKGSSAPSAVVPTNNDLTEPLLATSNATNGVPVALSPEETEAQGPSDGLHTPPPNSKCCTRRLSPPQIKNIVLVKLFVLTSFYQVYAGLKVATYDHAIPSIIPLLCLTVLWINAQAYVVRTIIEELTREKGLFLPPEVHSHPMYFQSGRGLAVHWCDLCRQRIGGGGGSDDSNNNSNAGCYRCALCDFDVCLKCAKRNDAATVGENVLRGDRGVRVEASLSTSAYLKRSLQVARSELPLLTLSFLLLAASSASQLLLPHFQGHIIDKVIPDTNGQYDKDGFIKFIRIYVLVMLVQGAISTLYSAIFTLVSRRLKFTIRNALLEKIMAQDVAYFDGTESGRLISRLTNDLDLMMAPIQSSLSSLLSNMLILFGGMLMCYVKSYRLSMLAFVTVGPISYLWDQYAQWSKGLAREMLSYWAEGNSIASQALSHIRTVKAFGCEDKVLKSYSETNQHALKCGVKDAWGNGLTSALTGYLDLGSGVLILYFGGLLVYNGELSVGELVTFQLFWNMMNNAYQNLQGLVTSFTRSAAGAEKVFSLWDSDPDIDPNKGMDVSWDVSGHLQLQGVTFYYQMRPDNIVLNKFELNIPAGKTVALVGRSGGGKSTIINLLLRFYDPREGKILLDGRDYTSLRVHQLRRLFGVVTQETELFALTVEENIAYGLDKDEYTMEDVIHAAKKANAHDFIVEMKDGYQTRIGERGNRLSGGQRQRLAIARVFLRRPKLILLDEATSALDENSQEAVQEALSTLIAESNATVVLVAHRLSTVVNADSICVIDKGTVLEQGNHDELVALGGIYATMVEKQLKKKADLIEQDKKDDGEGTGTSSADDINALLDSK